MRGVSIDRRGLLGAALAFAAAPAVARARTPSLAEDLATAINEPAVRPAFVDRWASPGGLKREPAEAWIVELERVRAATGGVDLLDGTLDGRSTMVRVRTRKQGVERVLTAHMDRDAPGKLYRLVFIPRPTPWTGPLPAEALTPTKLLKAIESRVAFAVDRNEFSGAISLVSPDGSIFYEAAHGLANHDDGVRIARDSRFHIGSADKSFTALLIGRHISEGRLTLDSRVADLLPTYINREAAAKITVRHLLAHTSGLGGLWDRPNYDKHRPNTTVSDILPAFSDAVLAFEPGARASYSNEGFVVLGAIVEAVGGATWYEQLARHVYAPAEMTRSGHFIIDEIVQGRVVGYRFADDDDLLGLGDRRPNWSFLGYRGNSCGGGYSTTTDMTRYLRALREGRLSSKAIYDQFTVQSPGGQADYGLGFVVRPVGGRTAVGHGGGGPRSGIDGDSWLIKETGWACSILGNYDAPFVQDLSRDIRTMVAAQSG